MRDYVFEEMLNRRANVTRSRVAVDGEGLNREPEYRLEAAAVPLRLRLTRATLDSGLLGAFPGAEAVGYTLPDVARATDRLGVIVGREALQEEAPAGSSAISVAHPETLRAGERLHLRDVGEFEEVVVAGVAGEVVTLRDPLGGTFAAGANVERVESYEVLGAEATSGGGHHQRLALRKRV